MQHCDAWFFVLSEHSLFKVEYGTVLPVPLLLLLSTGLDMKVRELFYCKSGDRQG